MVHRTTSATIRFAANLMSQIVFSGSMEAEEKKTIEIEKKKTRYSNILSLSFFSLKTTRTRTRFFHSAMDGSGEGRGAVEFGRFFCARNFVMHSAAQTSRIRKDQRTKKCNPKSFVYMIQENEKKRNDRSSTRRQKKNNNG